MRTRTALAGLLLMAACADHTPTGTQLTLDPRSADLYDALDPGLYWRDTDTLWVYDRKPEWGPGTHSPDATAIGQLQSLNTRITRYTLWSHSYQNDPGYKSDWISNVANMCAAGLKPVIVVHGWWGESWSGFPSFMNGVAADNPCVQHWQLWNEPDSDDGTCTPANCVFGMGPPFYKGMEYAAMLIQTYPQIKAANPNALVLTAGVNFGNGVSFLQGVYAGGGRKYFDIATLHPYGGATAQWDEAPTPSCAGVSGAGVRSYGQCLHNLFANHGDQGRMLWSTEFGVGGQLIVASWPTAPNTGAFFDDVHRQWWIDAIGIASSHKHYQKMIGYQLVAGDGGAVPTDGGNAEDYGFGIIRPGGAWRPAATWLQSSGYNTHALQYFNAAGYVTVYAPGKRPVGYSYTRNGSYVTFWVLVNKMSRTVVAFEPESGGGALTASIAGNDEIAPYVGCSWSAVVSGGTPPYEYSWTVNGQPVGGNDPNLGYTNTGMDFRIRLEVTDAQQASVITQKWVAVIDGQYCT